MTDIHHSFFVHSIDEYLGYLHILVIVNDVIINMAVQTPLHSANFIFFENENENTKHIRY